MGNSCCNKQDPDVHGKDFAGKPQTKPDQGIDPDLLKRAKENEEQIVKL